MKRIALFISLFIIPISVPGQTGEEILCHTEDEYRRHSNYIDNGQCSTEIYSTPITTSAFKYFLAMDREGNVHHWINEIKFGKTFGVIYSKNAKDSVGVYLRSGADEEPFPCSLYEAGGRLIATGGRVLFLTASIFYPEFLKETPGDASRLQYYDEIKRLADTLIDGEPCFVIETNSNYIITEKMADDSNRRGDSIRVKNGFAPIHQNPPYNTEAGPRNIRIKYYIRHKDFMMIRYEEFLYEVMHLKSKKTLKMNPEYDLKNFAKYLRE